MGLIIEDGKGRGFSVSVSESNRLNVSAKIAHRSYYVSRDRRQAFAITSIDADAVAGDFILYIKNISSTKLLFVNDVHVSAVQSVLWKLWTVTGTAAGSSALTPANFHSGAGITAEATVRGNGAVSGLSTDRLMHAKRTLATGSGTMEVKGAFILSPNTAFAVEYDTGTTGIAEVTVEFHFEDIDRAN